MITDGLNPLTVLLFLGAVFAGVLLIATYVFARVTKREPLARVTLRVLLGGVGTYAAVLLVASFASRNRVLAAGQEKHICEVDCHLAYSIVATKSEPLPGGHVRRVITVKVRFDEETISARRPTDARLTPNSRYVALVDAQGRQYAGPTEGLRRSLMPGESYTTEISFDLPADARDVRLILRNADPETTLIVGHENSLLHGTVTFALPG